MTEQDWLIEYRRNKTAVWIKLEMTDGTFQYHDSFDGWLKVKATCEELGIFIKKMALQFRSHRFDIDIPSDCDAVYFIRSLKGAIGGDAKDHYTVGTARNGIVHKLMITIPELTLEDQSDDTIEQCFAEAMIYNEEKLKNRQEQV
jgi:hypothetical protein